MTPPQIDVEYHARILDVVRAHMALNGSLRPTAFVHVEDGDRIVLVDSLEIEDQNQFIDVVRRTSAERRSPRCAIARECFKVDSEDPVELAAMHHAIMQDPGILETHPLMIRGLSIQVESEEGLVTSFHAIERHHPQMADVQRGDARFQSIPHEMRGRLNGFHVPAVLRGGPEMEAVMERVRHLTLRRPDEAEQPVRHS